MSTCGWSVRRKESNLLSSNICWKNTGSRDSHDQGRNIIFISVLPISLYNFLFPYTTSYFPIQLPISLYNFLFPYTTSYFLIQLHISVLPISLSNFIFLYTSSFNNFEIFYVPVDCMYSE